jgi:hypothetical protein
LHWLAYLIRLEMGFKIIRVMINFLHHHQFNIYKFTWAAAVFRDFLENKNDDPPLRAHPRVARFALHRSMGHRWRNLAAIVVKNRKYYRRVLLNV